MTTITTEQQAAIAELLEGMTLPSGLGTKKNACFEGWGGGVEGVEGWFDRLWVLFGRPYYERWEDA